MKDLVQKHLSHMCKAGTDADTSVDMNIWSTIIT